MKPKILNHMLFLDSQMFSFYQVKKLELFKFIKNFILFILFMNKLKRV